MRMRRPPRSRRSQRKVGTSATPSPCSAALMAASSVSTFSVVELRAMPIDDAALLLEDARAELASDQCHGPRGRRDEAGAEEAHRDVAGGRRAGDQNRDVGLRTVLDLARGARRDLEVDARLHAVEAAQARHQQVGHEERRRGDPQHPPPHALGGAVDRRVETREQRLDLIEQRPAGVGELDGAGLADEHPLAEVFLEVADPMADRRGRDEQRVGRSLEAELPCRDAECAQAVEQCLAGNSHRTSMSTRNTGLKQGSYRGLPAKPIKALATPAAGTGGLLRHFGAARRLRRSGMVRIRGSADGIYE
jgi:hypothetical protein